VPGRSQIGRNTLEINYLVPCIATPASLLDSELCYSLNESRGRVFRAIEDLIEVGRSNSVAWAQIFPPLGFVLPWFNSVWASRAISWSRAFGRVVRT
jgi:hypothetical protein